MLALLAASAAILAARLWPAGDPETLAHLHRDLPPDDPHLAQAEAVPGGFRHIHPFVIDGPMRAGLRHSESTVPFYYRECDHVSIKCEREHVGISYNRRRSSLAAVTAF